MAQILPRLPRPFGAWLGNIPTSDSKTPMLPITLSMTRRMCQTCMSGIGSIALKIQVKATEAKRLVPVDCRTRTPQLSKGEGHSCPPTPIFI